MGTLDDSWIASMAATLDAARQHGKPVVFDPVGAGATRLRTQTARRLVEAGGVSVIRGNASEIAALAGSAGRTKGVDSLDESLKVADAAAGLLSLCDAVVISGEKDVVVGRDRRCVLGNGCAMMTRVTGMGCNCSGAGRRIHAVRRSVPRGGTPPGGNGIEQSWRVTSAPGQGSLGCTPRCVCTPRRREDRVAARVER
jgi:hydroxyethylthiazole kinase